MISFTSLVALLICIPLMTRTVSQVFLRWTGRLESLICNILWGFLSQVNSKPFSEVTSGCYVCAIIYFYATTSTVFLHQHHHKYMSNALHYDTYYITRQWEFFSSITILWDHHYINDPLLNKTLLWLYYSFVKCYHWENLGKVCNGSLHYFLQLYVSL